MKTWFVFIIIKCMRNIDIFIFLFCCCLFFYKLLAVQYDDDFTEHNKFDLFFRAVPNYFNNSQILVNYYYFFKWEVYLQNEVRENS